MSATTSHTSHTSQSKSTASSNTAVSSSASSGAASSSSKGIKRARKARAVSDREKITREISHTETLLRNARSQRDEADNKVERDAYQKLVGVYDAQVEDLKAKLATMDSKSHERKLKEAVLSAVRRMGKALPSKTLESNPELLNPIRDAVLKALADDDQRQTFLAGVGSGLQDLNRPRKKNRKDIKSDKNEKVVGDDKAQPDDRNESNDSNGEIEDNDEAENPVDKSAEGGNQMDTSD